MSTPTRTVRIGIRIDVEKGIAFFGADEVNRRVAEGARVVEVRPGGAIMRELGADDGHVSMTLSGCEFEVVLSEG